MGALATDARWQLFVCGCAGACSGELLTTPIDMVKTRMQLSGELGAASRYAAGWPRALATIVREEGALELYRGLQPALLRAASYGSLRVGLYEPIKEALAALAAGLAPSTTTLTLTAQALPGLGLKILAGMISGGVAAGICCPSDVAKVRMQADGMTRGERRYGSALHALRTIHQAEGLRGLYSGVVPTMQRAAIVAAVELAAYDEVKQQLVRRLGLDARAATTHLSAAICAGFFSSLAASPADVVRSRMMSQVRDAAGRGLVYSTSLECLRMSIRIEGWLALWKGWGPSFARTGPHACVNFLVIEQLRNRFFTVEASPR